MRNEVLKIFAALFGLGMLVSCANKKLTAENDTLEIVFRPIVSPNTKLAYSDDKSFPATLPFRLWAFDSAGESLLDGVDAYPVGDGLWKVAGDLLWSRKDEELTIYAAAPSERMDFDKEKGVLVKGYSMGEDVDLFYSTAVLTTEKGSAVMELPLSFQHALASLRILVTNNLSTTSTLTVKELILSDIVTESDFSSLPAPRWSAGSQSGELVFWKGETILSDGENELEPAQFLIPQSTYAKCTLVCDVETGTSVLRDQVLSANFALNLRSGKHTTYRVSIYGDLSIKIEKDGI